MPRTEREMVCRRCAVAQGGGPLPFVLPGARATYAPDRVCDVRHLRVEVALDFEHRAVDGVCIQTVAPLNDGPTRLELNAVEMSIHAVTLGDGESLPFSYDGKLLSIDLGERKQDEPIDVVVRYHAAPRRGLYFIHPDDGYPKRPLQAWSQGQDEDNRHWFPCFDHPHMKSTSEVVATVPERMTVLSNGTLVEERHDAAAQKRTFHYRQDVAHSSYLITLVAGEYAVLRDRVGEVDLLYYVTPGREEDAPRTFGRTAEMIRLFADKTGHPYPYPRYSQITVAEFIFGGMENTSATTLTDQTLHDARAHLDFSSEPLISHELAHQWFGDLLTCRDWSEGWLNEGFATYLEIIWKEHSSGGGRDEADYDRLADMEAYFDEDGHRYRRPIVTKVFHEPIDVFDRHLYEKGSAVLHMLRTELGEARFWKAIQHYVARHKGRSVETRDLVRAVDEATGWNGDRFFDQWVFGAGHPELKVEYAWDDAQKLARLQIKQTQEVKDDTPLFHLPLTVRFVVDGEPHDVKLRITAAEETFVFVLASKPSQAIVDPGNAYLKTLDMKKPDELWRAELAGAALGIDRVSAARALGKAGEPTAIAALETAMKKDSFWAVRGEAALALSAIKTDAARVGIAAALSKEAHPKARRQMVKALGAFRHDAAAQEAAAEKLHAGDASYFVEAESALTLARTRAPTAFDSLEQAMSRPSYLDVIRSQCLAGMAELRDERGIDVALEAARYGQPPVGRRAAISALGALGAVHPARRRQVLERLTELLEDTDFRARIAAVEALRTLGDADALSALGRASQRDLDGRVRRRAREVQKAIAEHAVQDEAVRTLRDTLEKLEGENRDLKERLSKIEARLEQKA
jgi:aminopeptidase N